MKTAICQVADTGPLESLAVMLRSAGYQAVIPDPPLRAKLREIGCDTVLNIPDLVMGMGYDWPAPLPEVNAGAMAAADLWVDVKAHRNGPKVWRLWPGLRRKTLWYRINGGKPEWVVNQSGDHGNEVDPPCPILTPNQWYAERSWAGKAYTCWPPYVRFGEHPPRKIIGRATSPKSHAFSPPLCLIHNLAGWGYAALIGAVRDLGVQCHGRGSPDGLVPHKEIVQRLSRALAMVHLKSSDAPGYAIYEAMAAGCPVICTRRLIWRCKMDRLLIPNETCLVFDRETHDPLSEQDVADCKAEIAEHLRRLADPAENLRIGAAGRAQLQEVMWDEARDGPGFKAWMERTFP